MTTDGNSSMATDNVALPQEEATTTMATTTVTTTVATTKVQKPKIKGRVSVSEARQIKNFPPYYCLKQKHYRKEKPKVIIASRNFLLMCMMKPSYFRGV